MDQRIIDAAIRQWRTRLRACLKAKGGTHIESVMCFGERNNTDYLLDIYAKF